MQIHAFIPSNDAPLLNVRAPEDIEFLVKESEVLTGKPGRTFVIAGADRLSYRVQWHPMGSKVERLDEHGHLLSSQHLLPWEFLDHSVVEALRAGSCSSHWFAVPVDHVCPHKRVRPAGAGFRSI